MTIGPCQTNALPRLLAAALLLTLTLLVPCPGRTAEAFDLERLIASLAIEGEFRSDYRERRYSPLLTEPVTAHGELVFRPPDHLEKRTVGEAGQRAELVIDGDSMTLSSAEGTRHFAVDRAPELASLMAGLRALAAGDAEALRRRFDRVRLEGRAADWRLTLTLSDGPELPDRGAAQARSVTVVLAGGDGRLRRMELAGNDQRVVLELGPASQ